MPSADINMRDEVFLEKKTEKEFLNLWVKNLLIVRFVFWPEENILALVEDYPGTIASDFVPAIHFQNGTNQDYEFEVWGNNIRLFNSLRKVAQGLSEKAVEDELGIEPASSEYGRRAAMHSRVFKSLELEVWLYGESGNFVRFSMSGLTSQELTTAICLRVRVAVDRLETDGTFL